VKTALRRKIAGPENVAGKEKSIRGELELFSLKRERRWDVINLKRYRMLL